MSSIESFDRSAIKRAVQKVNEIDNSFWSVQGGAVPFLCSVMLNRRLEIMGDEFLTFIDHYDEFNAVNSLFARSISLFVDKCARIWVNVVLKQHF